jgi:MFS family permease
MFVVAGIVLGRFVDQLSRKYMLFVGLLLWSAMTALSSFTTNFGELLACRIGLGIGQAVCNPASFAVIADYFPPEKRPLANSLYNFGIYMGNGIAAGLGSLPWKITFPILGLVGGGLSVLLMFTVQGEPLHISSHIARADTRPIRIASGQPDPHRGARLLVHPVLVHPLSQLRRAHLHRGRHPLARWILPRRVRNSLPLFLF